MWVALDADSRPVAAMVAGDRSEDTARRLWAARPAEYRDEATVCTDFWSAYVAVVPSDRHAALRARCRHKVTGIDRAVGIEIHERRGA